MSQQLSSRWTPFYKFILPVMLVGGMLVGAVVAWLRPESQKGPPGFAPEYTWIFIVVLALAIGAIIWWTVADLMAITLDDDELLISNYRAEIRVWLRDIESISGPSVTNPKRHTITFVEPTEFGRSVTFIPAMDWTLMRWGVSEAVTTLNAAWEAARARRR